MNSSFAIARRETDASTPVRTIYVYLELLSSHMIGTSWNQNPPPSRRLSIPTFVTMSPDDEVQAVSDTATENPQKKARSSSIVRGASRLTTRSGLSGGVGPLRPIRSSTSISTNADIGIVGRLINDSHF